MINKAAENRVIVKDLHETGSLLTTILNRTPQFIGISRNPFSDFIMVNETGWKLLGMESEAELIHRNVSEFFADDVSPNSLSGWKKQLEETGQFSREMSMKTKSGS